MVDVKNGAHQLYVEDTYLAICSKLSNFGSKCALPHSYKRKKIYLKVELWHNKIFEIQF